MDTSRITRAVGAVALLVTGAVHLQLYEGADYAVIPTIGTLFILNFVAATVIGFSLLVPLPRRSGRGSLILRSALALAGIAVAGGALVALMISEHAPLFGFREYGYRFVIVLAIAAEATAVLSLTAFLIRARSAAGAPSGPAAPASTGMR